jgi:hypothetical protein
MIGIVTSFHQTLLLFTNGQMMFPNQLMNGRNYLQVRGYAGVTPYDCPVNLMSIEHQKQLF